MHSNRSSAAVAVRLEGLGGDELLAVAAEAVRRAARRPVGDADDASLVASVTAWHRLECAVHAGKLRRIAEVENREAWRGQAYNSVNLWTARLGVSRGEARTLVDSALALERMPGTAERLADGRLSPGHVADAARTIGQLARLDSAAGEADAGEVGAGEAGAGGTAVTSEERLDRAAAALDAVVAGEADSQPAGAGEDSGAGQDGGSAVQAVSREVLRRRLQEFQHEQAPELLAERERRLRARRSVRFGRDRNDPDQAPLLNGTLAPVTYAKAQRVISALARKHEAGDPRSYDQRAHDALDTVFDIAIASGLVPDAAGEQPRVILTVSADTLHEREGAPQAVLDGYGPVSSATARQLCCDAEVTVVARGDGGRMLNVGRDRRRPNRRQRRATFARDGACIGCKAPLAYCQIHHVVYWSDGGPTDIDNLVAVYWDCHARVHHYGWRVVRREDGAFRLVPPGDRWQATGRRLAS